MTSLADARAARDADDLLCGMAQRARLLWAVQADLRGAQLTVRSGALPQLLARALCARPDAPGAGYTADLVRCPDGIWRVARDRAGAAPGPSMLEAPVLAAFLPCLCRRLLNENLALPSVPAWWLAEPDTRTLLMRQSDRLSLRDSIDPALGPIRLSGLSASERIALQACTDRAPDRFVVVLSPTIQPVTLSLPGPEVAKLSRN